MLKIFAGNKFIPVLRTIKSEQIIFTTMTTQITSTEKVVKMLMIKGSYFAMDLIANRETEKAFLFNVLNTVSGENRDFWIPKSVLSKNDNEWVMPSWFVQKQFAPIA